MSDGDRLIVLEGERPPSWNQLYEQRHWAARMRMVRRIHAAVRAEIDPDIDPYDVPVDIRLTAYFARRPLDPDNLPAKIYIDGLRPWVIADDSPRCIRSVTTCSRIDRRRPRIEIQISPAK
jgi:hypothetical protein